jgi:hypothetical protein
MFLARNPRSHRSCPRSKDLVYARLYKTLFFRARKHDARFWYNNVFRSSIAARQHVQSVWYLPQSSDLILIDNGGGDIVPVVVLLFRLLPNVISFQHTTLSFGEVSPRALAGVSAFASIQDLRLCVDRMSNDEEWTTIEDMLAAVAPSVRLLYLHVLGRPVLGWGRGRPARATSLAYPRLHTLLLVGNGFLIECFRGSSMPELKDISISIHEYERREECIPALMDACADTLVRLFVRPGRSFERVLVDAPDYLVDALFARWDARTPRLIVPDPASAARVVPYLPDDVRYFRVRGPLNVSSLRSPDRADCEPYERLLEALHLRAGGFQVVVHSCHRLRAGRQYYQVFRPDVWHESGGLGMSRAPSSWPKELRDRWAEHVTPAPFWTYHMSTSE